MPAIPVSNGTFAFADSNICQKYKQDKFFENHGEARHEASGRTLAQIVLGLEKNSFTPYYFVDGNKFNCEKSNLTLEIPNNLFSTSLSSKVKQDHLTQYEGVEFRKKATKISSAETPGWFAVYTYLGRECIAGPFKNSSEAAEAYNYCTGTEVNKVKKFKPKGGHQTEAVIQRDIVKFLQLRGWLVHVTHMNQMESGWPDLNIIHPRYGVRFVDVKVPNKGSLTKRQKEYWPTMHTFGAGPYIMTAATEYEYRKLFGKPNYSDYMVIIGEGGHLLQSKRLIRDAKEKKL